MVNNPENEPIFQGSARPEYPPESEELPSYHLTVIRQRLDQAHKAHDSDELFLLGKVREKERIKGREVVDANDGLFHSVRSETGFTLTYQPVRAATSEITGPTTLLRLELEGSTDWPEHHEGIESAKLAQVAGLLASKHSRPVSKSRYDEFKQAG